MNFSKSPELWCNAVNAVAKRFVELPRPRLTGAGSLDKRAVEANPGPVRRRRAPRRRGRSRPGVWGVTLLEVILAIAILGGSLAILGEMVRVGSRASRSARLISSAQMLAESLAAEITAGVAAPESTEGLVEQFGGSSWAYTVQVQQVEQQGLLSIVVTVQDQLDESELPTSYTLTRWMIDPEVELDMEMAHAEMQAAAQTAAGGDTGDSTGSSGEGAGGDASGGGDR